MGTCGSRTANQTVPDTDFMRAKSPQPKAQARTRDGENDLDALVSPDMYSTDCIMETDVVFEFPQTIKNITDENDENEEETSETAETKAGSRAVSRRASTANAINSNIINGWKDAVESGNDSLCSLLYNDYPEYNKDFLNTIFINGDNSLHVACCNDTSESYKLVQFLINDCKMDVNSSNMINGKTALHYACEKRDDELVSLLLFTFYADPSISDDNGVLPMDIATSKRHKCDEIKEILTRAFNGDVKSTRKRSDGSSTLADDGSDSEDVYTNNNGVVIIPDSKQLKLSKITKENPFRSRFRKANVAAQRDHIARGYEILLRKKNKLPKLKSCLEKQRPKPPFQWQKRWLVVVDDYLLWSDTEISNINNTNNNNSINADNGFSRSLSAEDRMKFNGNLKINSIVSVIIPMEPDQNKICFMLKAKNKRNSDGTLREYLWKCGNRKERDRWVNGLTEHIKFYKEAGKYDIV